MQAQGAHAAPEGKRSSTEILLRDIFTTGAYFTIYNDPELCRLWI
jgi:hypothetical protein